MRKTPRIGCMGELLVELVCTSRNGRHRVVSSYLGPFPSGASGIFIDQAAQIGGRCFFVGARGADHVVLKQGENGSQALSRDGARARFPAHKVEVLDPTGAGDCFCATFVTLIASGDYSLEAALARANAAGALAVTKIGPMEGNSTLAEGEALLAPGG